MTIYVGRDTGKHQTLIRSIGMNKRIAELLGKSKCKFHGS